MSLAMVSRNHHRRHLNSASAEEQATFDRTAPILRSSYWDVADSLHDRNRDPSELAAACERLNEELQSSIFTSGDKIIIAPVQARLRQLSSDAIQASIDSNLSFLGEQD